MEYYKYVNGNIAYYYEVLNPPFANVVRITDGIIIREMTRSCTVDFLNSYCIKSTKEEYDCLNEL